MNRQILKRWKQALTLADQQREFLFNTLAERFPDLVEHYEALYPPRSYGPSRLNWPAIALRIKELCEQYGISDRVPRPIIPGDKRTLNKLVVEALANQVYYMELNGGAKHFVSEPAAQGRLYSTIDLTLGRVRRCSN